MQGQIAATEITKVSVFVGYLEKNAPGLGDAANYTSQLTQGIKDQIEKTGSCPFIPIFEQAKGVVPGHAMQGYAQASRFTEYLIAKTPNGFRGKDGTGFRSQHK